MKTIPNDEYLSCLHYLSQKYNFKIGVSTRDNYLHNIWLSLPPKLWAKNFANGKYIMQRIYDGDVSDAARVLVDVLRKDYGISL